MLKRVFALFTILLFLPVLAFAECNHHDEDGRPYGLVPRGYVPPQPGVPGWSGDQCCAACGAVVIRGSEIPALPEEDRRDEKKEEEDQPVVPADVPVVSVEQPEPPVVSVEQPQEQPVSPAQPEAPVVPAAQPVTPAETKEQAPVQPAESRQETQVQPESKPADLPAPPPEEKKTEQKQTNKPADSGKKTSGGGGKTKKAGRERFSDRFPYRRVKMTPDPEYIAEFAGELLWPLTGSPFLEMFD